MKMQVPFMQLPICFDAAALRTEVEAVEPSAWRPHPQGYAGNDALTLIATDGNPASDAASGAMRPTPHLERSPYLQRVLASIGGTWGRTRLMRLSGHAEVMPHVDVNYYWRERIRVHVPIVTQPTVRFVCGGEQVNMREGECWIFDTWRQHHVVNDHVLPRIHLVADTVGGTEFWRLVRNSRPNGRDLPGWSPQLVQPGGVPVALDLESQNLPAVMTPWEIRSHIAFMQGEAMPHPKLPAVIDVLATFVREWQALWACYGEQREGWPRYRALLDATKPEVEARGGNEIFLRNGVRVMDALEAWVFVAALADRRDSADPEVRHASATASTTTPATTGGATKSPAGQAARAPAVVRETGDPLFDRPVFIVSPPRTGSTFLFETLAQSPSVFTIGDESHQLIEGVPGLAPEARGFASNRLLAEDATPAIISELRQRFASALRDRDQRPPLPPGTRIRMLEKTPKNALRVPFLAAVFPEARFLYLHRDPRQVLSSMMEAWASGRFRMYANLPNWTGVPWSLLLVPGWQQLIGQPLHRIVATQWHTTTRLLLDDLERLPAGRWSVVRYAALVADPEAEIRRVCEATSIEWDRALTGDLPLSRYTVSPPHPQKWQRHAAEIESVLPSIEDQISRAENLAAG